MQDLGQNSQDARDAIKELFAEITKNKPTLNAMVVDISSMTAGFNKMSKEMQLSGTLTKDLERTYKNSNTLVASIQSKLKETNATQAETQAAVERIKNINQNSLDIASNMETAVGSLYKLEVARATGLTGIYASQAAEYSLMVEKGLLTKEQYENHLKDLKLQEKMQNHLDENLALEEAIAAQIVEIREETESWKKSFEKVNATARAIANDPKTLAFFAFNEGVKGLEKMHHTFHEMHEMGLSAGQAMEGTFKQMDITSMDWWLGLSDTQGVMKGIVGEYGNVNALSKDTVSQLGKMATSFGISGEEAAKLNASLSQIPGETSESAANAMEHVGAMAKMQGIAPGKIMKDMAKNTGEMSRQGTKGAEAFGKSVIALHKMGVEMSTASKIADGLLDFENSINQQMEASVLLGKEINLDKAREAALNNDMEGMTAEIAKNIGGAAEFGKMNRLQQDALAKSVGMSTEELAKMMDAQEESNKYFGEGASIGMNAMGYMMQYGGAAAGFLKENAMLLMVGLQAMSNEKVMKMGGLVLDKLKIAGALVYQGIMWAINGILNSRYIIGIKDAAMEKGKQAIAAGQLALQKGRLLLESTIGQTKMGMWIKEKAQWALEKAHFAWKKAAAALGGGGAAAKGAEAAAGAAGKMGEAAGAASKVPAGAGKSTGGLTKAIEKINPGKLLAGAAALILVAAAVFVFAKAAQEFMSVSWEAIGMAIVAMLALVGALALIGAIMMSGVGALAILAGAAAMLIMAAALWVLGKAIQEIAKGFEIVGPVLVSLAPMAMDIVALGAGLALMGYGMIALGLASWIAAPGLMFAAFALTLMLPATMALNELAQSGGLSMLGEAFMMIAASAPGLLAVAGAMMGIGAGLGLVAIAGFAALPIFGAMMALAAVAPMLATLGSLFGGGGDEGGKDDKMDKVVEKLDQLIAVASKGGEVKMDGKKVGEIIRLGLNTSNVR